MIKIGLEIKQDGSKVHLRLVDPSKKQLEEASDDERLVAQKVKDLFDIKLIDLLDESLK